MGKKKEAKQETKKEDGLCHPNGCPFFSLEPDILEDKIVDGVRQRKVKRLCLFDLSKFKAGPLVRQCPREIERRRREKQK